MIFMEGHICIIMFPVCNFRKLNKSAVLVFVKIKALKDLFYSLKNRRKYCRYLNSDTVGREKKSSIKL